MKKFIICHDMYGKIHKVKIKDVEFRPSVYGILIEKNKLLLQKYKDGYDFPGGGAKIHETIEQTLKREFWEETGFKVKPIKLACVGSFFRYSIDVKKAYNVQYYYFIVKKIGGSLSKANLDENENKYADLAEWIGIKQIKKIIFYNDLYTSGSMKLIRRILKENYG